jgi:hypothetical protein
MYMNGLIIFYYKILLICLNYSSRFNYYYFLTSKMHSILTLLTIKLSIFEILSIN